MPWKNVTLMEEISRFVMLAQTDRFTITDLCDQFGISRKTGYKHLERYALHGLEGNRKHLRLYLLPFSATSGANAYGWGRRCWQRTSGRISTRPCCDATPRPIPFRRPNSPTDRGKR
ncbi:MAG: helix-turn-helix domain-containing protein [Verrucomicrobia bacterium]|nr:helix-turn-helix domain-containing protein [Verrucomicrobiota bacterium]